MPAKQESTVSYSLPLGDQQICLNDYLDKTISLEFQNKILCVSCGKPTKKSFQQGYCYPCFLKAPETSPCVINPELCEAHLGKGKDPEWEQLYHNQPHFVYFSRSSSIKVGVTRDTQIPTRWIDQGAVEALVFAKTPNRYLAGCIEVALKKHMTDKTHWQAMLKNHVTDEDLAQKKAWAITLLPDEYLQYVTKDSAPVSISYPVLDYPIKVKSINFDKTPMVEGRLMGIKGQYLLFGTGQVLNIRKHAGYVVAFNSH